MTLTKIEPFLPTNLAQTGSGLNRPECVLAARDGSLYTGDWTLGIARIAPDGTTGPAVEADLIAQGFAQAKIGDRQPYLLRQTLNGRAPVPLQGRQYADVDSIQRGLASCDHGYLDWTGRWRTTV